MNNYTSNTPSPEHKATGPIAERARIIVALRGNIDMATENAFKPEVVIAEQSNVRPAGQLITQKSAATIEATPSGEAEANLMAEDARQKLTESYKVTEPTDEPLKEVA
jgi:hypothetical protein